MRKINVILTLIVGLLIASCGGGIKPKSELLARKWNLKSVRGTISGLTITAYDKAAGANLIDFSKFSLTATADGKATIIGSDGTSESGTWKFIDNDTKVDFLDGKYILEIIQLTDTNFDFKTQYALPNDVSTMGINFKKNTLFDAEFLTVP
jgi:hypothetical protein